jgi:UDP-N-acetylglucosamine/UDP-N-acetylgalactosamine diphosphorylase
LQVCDPLLIGSHICAKSEMTTQVVQKRDPLERVGNVVSIDGRLQMIEYSDLPEEVARQRTADGSLKLWAGNLAVHVFDVPFLVRAVADADVLPYHAARKKVSCLNEQGHVGEPTPPNAHPFERFIFDLLPAARHALVVEVDPADAFAPVKNHDGEPFDTPTTARQAMMAQARRWLRAAGAQVADDTPVEINHRWALGPDDVRRKLPAGLVIAQPTYFAPDGPRVVERGS